MKLKMIDKSNTASEVIIAALIALKDKIGGDPVVSLALYEGDISVMMCGHVRTSSLHDIGRRSGGGIDPRDRRQGGPAHPDAVIQLLAEHLGIKPDGDDMIRLHAVYDGNQEEHKS